MLLGKLLLRENMKNIQQINDARSIKNTRDSVLVLGYFDGLHRGHKALFDQAREIAERDQLELTVLTFNESPRLALARFTPELLLNLTAPQKRYDKFAEYGVDNLYLIESLLHQRLMEGVQPGHYKAKDNDMIWEKVEDE